MVSAELSFLLRPGRRSGPVRVALDGTSTLGHLVGSLGVPLTEVGRVQVNGGPARPGYRPAQGDVVSVEAVRRPQHLPSARFVLDVHLGTLARRLRLVGVDAAYANDATDDALVWQANDERRVLLTQDRGLLHRRQLWQGAYVRGARPDEQLRDVLDRFAPPLAPWTRCPACNGPLSPAAKADIDPLLQAGNPGAPTRRSPAARTAARCTGAARTASTLSRSSTPPSAPSPQRQVNKHYQRHERKQSGCATGRMRFGRAVGLPHGVPGRCHVVKHRSCDNVLTMRRYRQPG